MASGLGELFVELGTIGNVKDLEKFVSKVREATEEIEKNHKAQDKTEKTAKKLGVGLASLVTVVVSAGIAWTKSTESLVKSNQAMLLLSRQSDITLSSLQKWESIGNVFGVNGLAGQIDNLNQKLFELRLTGQGARGFQLAGINPMGQNAEGVLEQLRTRIKGMDNTTASYLLQQMGLSPQILTILRMERSEFEEIGKVINRYQLTKTQREEIERLNIQLKIAQMRMSYIKDRIILKLMPILVQLTTSLSRITEMFAKFGNLLTKNGGTPLRALILGITLASIKFEKFGKFVKAIGSGLGKLITSIPIVGRLFGNFGKIVSKAFLPLLALWYLLDDLATFFSGGDSLIGRVLNWGAERGSEIGEAFKKMFGGDIFGGAGDLVEILTSVLNEILSVVQRIFGLLFDIVTLGLSSKLVNASHDKENHPYLYNFRRFVNPTMEEMGEDFGFTTPSMYNNTENKSSTNNNNTKISMVANITTDAPIETMDREVRYMQAQYSMG